MQRFALALLMTTATAPAIAQNPDQPAYLDDRSTPGALVRSLYNAINRQEYARAWSYFAEPPAASVDAYAQGYADTGHVDAIAGTPHEEGAAGSIYFDVPVAIRARSLDGSEAVFAGCYTLRMSNPANLGDEFSALRIERGSLAATEAELEDALPRKCGDGPELPPYDAALEKAKAMYAAAAPESCSLSPFPGEKEEEPQSYTLAFNYQYDDADSPTREARLFRFFCFHGAYNEAHVYYFADDEGAVSLLNFARPELDIRYAGDDIDSAVETITITGFGASAELINSEYDPQTRTLNALSLWRGIGDAFSEGRWAFREGKFQLVHYAVDASYDGEQNPETLIDYETGP